MTGLSVNNVKNSSNSINRELLEPPLQKINFSPISRRILQKGIKQQSSQGNWGLMMITAARTPVLLYDVSINVAEPNTAYPIDPEFFAVPPTSTQELNVAKAILYDVNSLIFTTGIQKYIANTQLKIFLANLVIIAVIVSLTKSISLIGDLFTGHPVWFVAISLILLVIVDYVWSLRAETVLIKKLVYFNDLVREQIHERYGHLGIEVRLKEEQDAPDYRHRWDQPMKNEVGFERLHGSVRMFRFKAILRMTITQLSSPSSRKVSSTVAVELPARPSASNLLKEQLLP
eukprot:TRINITY_DN1599_c0_g1_i1.p1 TRINITY_DN1599_c0_g1~~TRINITY_DN1599_c0_g1_i1.p1  ORF type:complete len:288 (+),score=59.01 TRINITY_DN1599_c0_g1_i1:332-1195(+)